MNDQNHTPHPAVVAELFAAVDHELQQRNITFEFHPLEAARKLLARQHGREANALQVEGRSESRTEPRTDLRHATSTE